MDFDFTTTESLDSWGDAPDSQAAEPDFPDRRSYPARSARTRVGEFSDEGYLIECLRAGEDDAYRFLMATQRERMSAIARRYFSEEQDVLDVVQEAFIAVFRAIDRFEGNAALSTWLYRVVVNACLMRLRTRRRKPEQGLTPALMETLVSTSTSAPSSTSLPDAQAALESHEISARIRSAIEALPENHRNVIRLRDLEEHDTRETARELVISQAAVKTRLHRARHVLRAELSAENDSIPRSA